MNDQQKQKAQEEFLTNVFHTAASCPEAHIFVIMDLRDKGGLALMHHGGDMFAAFGLMRAADILMEKGFRESITSIQGPTPTQFKPDNGGLN